MTLFCPSQSAVGTSFFGGYHPHSEVGTDRSSLLDCSKIVQSVSLALIGSLVCGMAPVLFLFPVPVPVHIVFVSSKGTLPR